MVKFKNVKFGIELEIDEHANSLVNIANILSSHDDYRVDTGSLNHILCGRRTYMGSWYVVRSASQAKRKPRASASRVKSNTRTYFSSLTPAQKIDNLREALLKAKSSGNTRLAQTLTQLIRSYDCKSIKGGNDMNQYTGPLTRPVINLKYMPIKFSKA